MNAPESIQPGDQSIRIARIARSLTNPRKHFDEGSHLELVESIKRHGIIQPILVRPMPAERDEPHYRYVLVAGERRLRAADAAGLAEIPALVRELGDAEVIEIQVIENLQRVDLHPLEEAEGYEALHDRHGYTVADIAAKVGKSSGYVYRRMRLTALCEDARQAFYEGTLTAATALLVARIPDSALQAEATKHIVRNWRGEPMTTREASEYVQRSYMLRLATAPFKPGDADLVPDAGPCTTCPRRTGNDSDLFEDIQGPDTCTDPACFARKTGAHKDRVIAKAEAEGMRVVDGKEAKAAVPYAGMSTLRGFVALDAAEWVDGKKKTARQIAGKDLDRVIVVNPHDGSTIEAVREKDYKALLVEKGLRHAENQLSAEQKRAAEKRRAVQAVRTRLFERLREPRALELEDRRMIASAMLGRLGSDLSKKLLAIWSWSANNADENIDALDAAQIDRLMMDMALIGETVVHTYGIGAKPETMLALAARLGVDVEALEREAKAELRAQAKEKKPGAKKAAKKAGKKAAPTNRTRTRRATPAAGDAPDASIEGAAA